jgi:hypothetical protein
MNKVAGALIDWWRRNHRNAARINRVRNYPSAADVPAQLGRHVIAIAGDPPSWAVLQCPCGTGHRLNIRLRSHGNAPVWQISKTDSGPSLRPSIDSDAPDRRCHFWLEKGRVRWVRD